MNKNVIELYNKALAVVLEEYGLSEAEMYESRREECVEAKRSLVVAMTGEGVSDKDIAELMHGMKRCSICKIRNRFNDSSATWTERMCIEHIKKTLA